MFTRIVACGRLTNDPETRQTTTGKTTTSFTIAVKKLSKPKDGEPDSSFFRVVAWGATAKFVTDYIGKGRLVCVDGRLEQRKYTDSNGQQREIIEIIADNVQGLDRPKEQGSQKPTEEEEDFS